MIRYTTGGVSVALSCYQDLAAATGGSAVDDSGAGTIVGSLVLASVGNVTHTGRVMLLGAIGHGVALLALAYCPWFGLAIPVLMMGVLGTLIDRKLITTAGRTAPSHRLRFLRILIKCHFLLEPPEPPRPRVYLRRRPYPRGRRSRVMTPASRMRDSERRPPRALCAAKLAERDPEITARPTSWRRCLQRSG